jgi:hypothetical protein
VRIDENEIWGMIANEFITILLTITEHLFLVRSFRVAGTNNPD